MRALVLLAAVASALADAPPPIRVMVDTSAVLATTSALQHGVAIDTLAKGLDWSDAGLVAAARALNVTLLRAGGSAQRSYPVCVDPALHPEPHNASCLTRQYWRSLCGFASATGLRLAYGLCTHSMAQNLQLLRNASDPASDAFCPSLLGWSLGNEGVPGSAAQFKQLRQAIDALPLAPKAEKPLLVGPESPIQAYAAGYFVPLANKASARDVALMKAVVANTTAKGAPVWLSEINSICDGGAANLSNTYANVPWLLNQLGQLGESGLQTMAQQTLLGNDYGLLAGGADRAQLPGWQRNLSARPNFFASLLHRKFAGDRVLKASVAGGGTAAMYAYCSGGGGGVAVVLLHFGRAGAEFALSLGSSMQRYSLYGLPKTRRQMGAPSDTEVLELIASPRAYLNDDEVPLSVKGLWLRGAAVVARNVALPGLGVTIVLAAHAKAAACKTDDDVPLPADWKSAVDGSNMLFAAAPAKYLPSIENGFIGGDVGCAGGAGGSSGTLHLAGLYSGGSHTDSRSTLSNPLAGAPAANLSYAGAALDLTAGVFYERWAAPSSCGADAVLQSARYAHRAIRSLLVLELSLIGGTKACAVSWKSCVGRAGGLSPLSGDKKATAGEFVVVDPEQPADPSFPRRHPAVVAVAADAQLTSVSLSPTGTALLLAVVHTTLEDGIRNATALPTAKAELAAHRATGATQLMKSHRAAWSDVYGLAAGSAGGGVELTGNRHLAAQANSSLYYLLCSVRSDWPMGISEGGIGSEAYRGMMFWSDGVMDGPLMAAINAPVARALLKYRSDRLAAAKAIAQLNGFEGAYWPWQSGVTGFERSCGNVSIAMKIPEVKPRVGCYWMYEIHIGLDVAMSFIQNYHAGGSNRTFLNDVAWPVISATADFFLSRANETKDGRNFTFLNVIGPDEHSYIVDSSTYTNAAAQFLFAFAADAASILKLTPKTLQQWKTVGPKMLVNTSKFCLHWPNASLVGCPPDEIVEIHPQQASYHGQDINQADVALLQWPLHLPMDAKVAKNDLLYYAERSSGSDTKGFYTGDSSYAVAMLFLGMRAEAAAQLAFANDHQISAFNIWTETDPKVASHNGTGNLNFLTGAGGFMENIVFGYGGLRYDQHGLHLSASLPTEQGVTALVIRGVAFGGGTVRLEVSATQQSLSRTSGPPLTVTSSGGMREALAAWPARTTLPLQPLLLALKTDDNE